MADLLAVLTQGSASLTAHRSATATSSHNIENASTPGYSRQSAELVANEVAQNIGRGFIGGGVSLQAIRQARDPFLESQVPGAKSSAARSQAEAEALESLSVLDPEASFGLATALGNFYGRLRALSQKPSDLGLRSAAVSAAEELSMAFRQSARAIDETRTGLDRKLSAISSEANSLAEKLATLNRQIRIARAGGAEPNDLLDARTQLRDRLSELTGARPVSNSAGDVLLFLPKGMALVTEERAASFQLTPDPQNRGHQRIQLLRSDGTGPVAISTEGLGGEVRGVLAARDEGLKNTESRIDTLAFDLGTALNGIHRGGVGLDGSTGLDLFQFGATVEGAASLIEVDGLIRANPRAIAASSSAASIPGDGTNLLALIDTENAALTGGLDAGATLAHITTEFGSTAARVRAFAEQDSGVLQHLETLRSSKSGVSIDEEMVNMMRSQRAFEAVIKVIQTADQMLDTLMKLR